MHASIAMRDCQTKEDWAQMGAIRKAFKVKNAIRHPIHTATRPVRRTVRKAVVPKSVRKAYYKTKSVSTAVHNPISASVRSLDGIVTSTNRNNKTYSDLSRERERLYREIRRLSKTVAHTSSHNVSVHSSLSEYKTRLKQIDEEIDSINSSTNQTSSKYVSTISNVNFAATSSAHEGAEAAKTIFGFLGILFLVLFVIMSFVQQHQQNSEKASTIETAYSACQADSLQLVDDYEGSPSIKGENVSPQTVSCLAKHMGVEDTFTSDERGDIQEWGDYRMDVFNRDPYNVVTPETEYSVEITFQRS